MRLPGRTGARVWGRISLLAVAAAMAARIAQGEPIVTSPARVASGWNQSVRLGESCVIPLDFDDPATETRVFLKHERILYLQPLGDWKRRDEVSFLPEAPGTYTVAIQWRASGGATGWIHAPFDVGRGCDLDSAPRLVTV